MAVVSQKDNTLRGAQKLGFFNNRNRTIKNFVGKADQVDFFQIRLSNRSSVSLRLDQLKANADLRLLNGRGGLIAQSRKGGKKPEQIATALDAGVYYIRVNRRSGDTKYRLRTSAVVVSNSSGENPVLEPGNTLTTARDLGTLSAQQTIGDFVGIGDDTDYYKFTLNQIQQLSATLTGTTESTALQIIYDANKNGVVDSGETALSAYGTGNVSITKTLPSGHYFLKVAPRSANGNPGQYQLTLTPTPDPGNLPTDPGNTALSAYNLGSLSGTRTLKDYVGTIDAADWYKFSLNQISNISLTLDRVAGYDAKVSLIRDVNNNGIFDSGELLTSKGTNYSIATDLPTGNYFVVVERWNSNRDPGRYDLTLTTTADPGNLPIDPGSTTSTAYNLGTLSGTRLIKDYVGMADELDYYKFGLNQAQTFTATLSGVDRYEARLTLVRDANNNGVYDTGELVTRTSSSLSFTTSLSAGNYFIFVEPWNSRTDPGRYDMTLTVA